MSITDVSTQFSSDSRENARRLLGNISDALDDGHNIVPGMIEAVNDKLQEIWSMLGDGEDQADRDQWRRERAQACHGLTYRESQILELVSGGLSNPVIAGKLWITEQTVKYHLTKIYRKMNVSNRTSAARGYLAL